ncbi:MAG: AmmeMemoRadiSam system radical SAM enzyme, partial [Treponema sp.]|nr:AmmeMemoRadiSam system radical SAM enzyme [Treponema sp.]
MMIHGPDRVLNCGLCPHQCRIPPGGRGRCGVRENRDGKLALPYSGYITAVSSDPIEKKPLYHFRPGSSILSLGFVGCNLRCPFCQNWHISQLADGKRPPGETLSPEQVIALAKGGDAGGAGRASGGGGGGQIAYTYSEPLIHFEYLKDCMELAHERGIANVLVSNGCINTAAAEKLLPLIDAANIDLKCFSEKTYREVLGGDLETVLNFIRAAYQSGVHLEITTLVVPGLNDSDAELEHCAEFIAGLQDATAGPQAITTQYTPPWHLSAYHPSYHWDTPPTKSTALLRAAKRARKILPYVYAGNIAGEENDTACPHCGAVLVKRRGYRVDVRGLAPPVAAARGLRA